MIDAKELLTEPNKFFLSNFSSCWRHTYSKTTSRDEIRETFITGQMRTYWTRWTRRCLRASQNHRKHRKIDNHHVCAEVLQIFSSVKIEREDQSTGFDLRSRLTCGMTLQFLWKIHWVSRNIIGVRSVFEDGFHRLSDSHFACISENFFIGHNCMTILIDSWNESQFWQYPLSFKKSRSIQWWWSIE